MSATAFFDKHITYEPGVEETTGDSTGGKRHRRGCYHTESDSLRQELAGQKELHLHLVADFENFKRRSRQESEARAAAQKESFIHELLPVIDNLERALASGASADSQQFHQGVEMTLQQLRLLLGQHGVVLNQLLLVGRQQELVTQFHVRALLAFLDPFGVRFKQG